MSSNIVTTSTTVPSSKNNATATSRDHTRTHAEPEQMPSDTVTNSSKGGAVTESDTEKDGGKAQPSAPKSFGFFAIIIAVCFSGLLTALEATITSTALPTIIAVLGGTDLFIWVVNGYYLTM
jgi:hypothetical protein